MKLNFKLLITLCLVLLFSSCSGSEITEYVNDELLNTEYMEHESIVFSNIHGMITRVSYNNNVMYIIGASHIGRPEWHPMNETVMNAKQRADVFLFESDLWFTEDRQVRLDLNRMQRLPGGVTLQTFLPEDVFERFYQNLATWGVPYSNVVTMSPLNISSGMWSLLDAYFGYYGFYGIDFQVMNFAQENNRILKGLHDGASELNLTFNISEELQIQLIDSIPDWETAVEIWNHDFLYAYGEQNIIILAEGASAFEDIENLHPHDYFVASTSMIRTNIFATEIMKHLRETNEPTIFFTTVGINHLLRDGFNVLSVLEENGFIVEPYWHNALS